MQKFIKLIQKNGILISFSLFFWGFFFALLFQGWNAFLLLILPLSQYVMFVWLQLISRSQISPIIEQYQINFLSFGNVNKISQKFFHCSILELSILIAMGIEAIYHPQLINSHFVLYLIPIVLVSIFSTFYGTYDLYSTSNVQFLQKNQPTMIIRLDTSKAKWISLSSRLLTAFLGLFWIAFSTLSYFNIFKFTIYVPFAAEELRVSSILSVVAGFVILHPIVLLIIIHRLLLREIQLHIKLLPEKSQRIYSTIVQNYIVIPRFFNA